MVQDKVKCLADITAAVEFETCSHFNCAIFNSTYIFAYYLEPDILKSTDFTIWRGQVQRPKVFHNKNVFFSFCFSFFHSIKWILHRRKTNVLLVCGSFSSFLLIATSASWSRKCLALFEHLSGKAN